MEYLVFFGVVVIVLFAKGLYDKITYDKKELEKIKAKFGTVSQESYTPEKFQSLKAFYEETRRASLDVDEITWNDLDMDEIFMLMNNTESAVGEEYLYAMLRQPQFSEDELAERERLISFFQAEEDKRQKIQLALHRIGKNRRFSIFACMKLMKEVRRESNLGHFLCAAVFFLSAAVIFINVPVGVVAFCASVIYNFISYFKRKGEMDAYLSTISALVLLLFSTEELAGCGIGEIARYTEKMKQLNGHFGGFKKNYWIIGSRKPTGDLLDSLLMYLRMMLHLDLMKFNRMLRIYDKYEAELTELYKTTGYLDALCSVASFRTLAGQYCVPEFTKGAPYLAAENMYHVLLSDPVKNSIETTRGVLLTGSNASGKSTFLKSAAVNALLAQTIHTVLADSYRASMFQVISSMSLRDNLQGNESYFIVEIKSLKRMFEQSAEPVCTLCFVDEVLRGTNTVERIAASREVLSGLNKERVMIFAATHDIELTYLLENEFDNYHFEETVAKDRVTFDYQLKRGRATSRNAIRLLGLLGYPEEVIQRAEASAEQFLATGEWR